MNCGFQSRTVVSWFGTVHFVLDTVVLGFDTNILGLILKAVTRRIVSELRF